MPQADNSKKIIVDHELISAYIDGRLESNLENKVAAYLDVHPELIAKLAAKSGDGFLDRLKEARVRSVAPSRSIEAIASTSDSVTPKPSSPIRSSNLSVPTPLANYAGYQVLKELGRGGMGVVYLAKNGQLDRPEVLKVLNERLLENAGAKDRFLREVRAVSKLNHPSIVKSFSILPIDELLVFAMEYVHGMDLHKFIQKHGALPISLACSFARQIAAGLQHAHEKGLVHRDIKPSNIMVHKSDGELQLKILDFGLSKATSEKRSEGLTQEGVMLGTPEYMAPEQTLNASKADIRADIYSLGCTLYHMLIGRAPFVGTQGEIMMAHARAEPQPMSHLRPELPLELNTLVLKMLAKQPDRRFQVPNEVMTALTPFLKLSDATTNRVLFQTDSNTVTDLASASRDTSVEMSKPQISLSSDQPLLLASVDQAPSISQTPKASPRQRRIVRRRMAEYFPSALSRLKTWVGKLSCTTLRVVIPTTRNVVQLRAYPKINAGQSTTRVMSRQWITGLLATAASVFVVCWMAGIFSASESGSKNADATPTRALPSDSDQEHNTSNNAESSVAPPLPLPITEVDERKNWKSNASQFVHIADKVWREDRGPDRPFFFAETNRTSEYVEIFDKSRYKGGGIYVRLYSDRATYQIEERGSNWLLLSNGVWQTTSKEPESSPTISLFNGQDFTGWKYDSDVSKTWKIERGELVGTGKHAILESQQEFKNFEIDAEISLRTVNSGLFFGGDNGYECELCIPSSDQVNALGSILLNGQPNGRTRPRVLQRVSMQQNKWMQLQLRVDGNQIMVKIDGVPIVDARMELDAETGPIYFGQWWNSGSIAIRKILIKELN